MTKFYTPFPEIIHQWTILQRDALFVVFFMKTLCFRWQYQFRIRSCAAVEKFSNPKENLARIKSSAFVVVTHACFWAAWTFSWSSRNFQKCQPVYEEWIGKNSRKKDKEGKEEAIQSLKCLRIYAGINFDNIHIWKDPRNVRFWYKADLEYWWKSKRLLPSSFWMSLVTLIMAVKTPINVSNNLMLLTSLSTLLEFIILWLCTSQ